MSPFLRATSPVIFKSIFECLKDLTRDANICFQPAGLRISSVDIRQQALMHAFIPAEDFMEYRCTTVARAGIVVPVVFRLLKTASASDIVSLSIVDRDLHICFENAQRNQSTKYTMKLTDIGMDIVSLDTELEYCITIPSSNWHRICKDLSGVGSTVLIESDGKSISLSTVGDFATQHTIVSELGVVDSLTPDIVFSGRFRLQPLLVAAKAHSLCITVSVHMGMGKPLVFSFECGAHGRLSFAFLPE